MPSPRSLQLAFASALLMTAAFGFGCAKNPIKQDTADIQNQLRQPPPAAAPTKQPEIPPEAAKVPRPY